MKRTTLLAATALIAVASTSLIATAQSNPGNAGKSGAMATMMLERFDTDGDGSVTRAEIDAVRAAGFEAADSDGDGLLNAEELAAWQEARRDERQAARAAARLARLDSDGDGMISAEELAAAGPPMAMFDRLDADDDGSLTAAEIEAAQDMRRGGGDRRGMKRGHGGGNHHGMQGPRRWMNWND